jgi:hypothetical protein
MATPYAPMIATGSTNGRLISVVATGSPGTTLHQVSAVAGVLDDIMIQATNTGTDIEILTIGWGAETADSQIIVPVPPQDGFTLAVSRGSRLTNNLTVTAWATTTAKVNCLVTVERYTPPA